MELKQLLGNTWYFKGKECIPLYQLDKKRCILLDTGFANEREALIAALDEAGLIPVGVFGSHAHRDHAANNFYLRERYGTQVCLPRGEAAMSRSILMYRAAYDNFSPQLVEQEYGGMIGEVDQEVGPKDGVIEFCGVPFRVIHTPGHTPDHICTITPDNACYLADALMTEDFLSGSKLPYHYGHAAARASMEKLKNFSCGAYLCAHNGPAEELARLVEGNLAVLDARAAEIAALIDRPMTLEEVYNIYVQRENLFTSKVEKAARYLRNLRMFLEYLTDTGVLELVAQKGMRYYLRPQA